MILNHPRLILLLIVESTALMAFLVVTMVTMGIYVPLLSSSFLAQCSLVILLEVIITPVGGKTWLITSLDDSVIGRKTHSCWINKCFYIFRGFTDISSYVRYK